MRCSKVMFVHVALIVDFAAVHQSLDAHPLLAVLAAHSDPRRKILLPRFLRHDLGCRGAPAAGKKLRYVQLYSYSSRRARDHHGAMLIVMVYKPNQADGDIGGVRRLEWTGLEWTGKGDSLKIQLQLSEHRNSSGSLGTFRQELS